MSDASPLPDLAEIVGPLLARVPPEQKPLLVAAAERMAAERYRGWADEPDLAGHAAALRACAAREEEIAARVESLHPDAAAIERKLLAQNPDLAEINRSLFARYTLREQLAIQARGERLGAATWRSFAKSEARPEAREAFLSCAPLEEASAAVLESILGVGASGGTPA